MMKTRLIYGFLLFNILSLLDLRPVQGQGCSDPVGCAVPVAGWGLNSLVFDPVTQVPTSVSLFAPEYDTWSNFTLQAWIYLTPVQLPAVGERPIFFKGTFAQGGSNGVPTSAELYLFVDSANNLAFRMGGGNVNYGYDLSAGPLRADAWTHVTVTVSSVTRVANLFIDGSLVNTQTWLLSEPSAPYTDENQTPRVKSPTGVGRVQLALYNRPIGTGNDILLERSRFNGRIDEVRIWSRSLPAPEVASTYARSLVGNENGLLSYFSFNEGEGSTVSSPWPNSGVGRRAPSSVATTTGTITGDELVWSSSEVQLNHPFHNYGRIGQTVTGSNRDLQFFLYAIVPSGATAASNLRYAITRFPTNGRLFWNGELIDENYVGDDIQGNRTDPYPLLRYSPNPTYAGTETIAYIAFYRDGTSDERSITFQLGCRTVDQCNICEGTNQCLGCDDSEKDACGICFGDGSTCDGCDGVPGSNKKLDDCKVCDGRNRDKDVCGVCFGNGTSCLGCDGVPNSGVVLDDCRMCGGMNRSKDVCGVCFGNGTSCVGCDGVAQKDPAKRRIIDACNVCTLPENANATCRGCDGKVSFPPKMLDVCGICDGNGTSCLSGCDNMPNSRKTFDVCGVCGGNGSTCAGCDGVPQKDPALRAKFDACGVCGGNGSSCADCDGVPYGPNPPDVCGECGGNGTWCLDCAGCPFGDAVVDDCGVCGGNNSTCTGCDGVVERDPALRAKLDVCGECGGNGTSCADQWCDPNIPLSKYDACNVCNGDNSTCMCVTYRNRTVAELDCALLEWALTNIVTAIDQQLDLMNDTKTALATVQLGDLNEWIGEQIRSLNSFISECTTPFCETLTSTVDELTPAMPSASKRSMKAMFSPSFGFSSPTTRSFFSLSPSTR